QDVNTVIDAVYAWMNGITDKPVFKLTIIQDKQTYIDFYSVAFKERLRGQPECAADFVVDDSYSPLTANCQPAGYDFNNIDKFFQDHKDDPQLAPLFQVATVSSDSFSSDPQLTSCIQTAY